MTWVHHHIGYHRIAVVAITVLTVVFLTWLATLARPELLAGLAVARRWCANVLRRWRDWLTDFGFYPGLHYRMVDTREVEQGYGAIREQVRLEQAFWADLRLRGLPRDLVRRGDALEARRADLDEYMTHVLPAAGVLPAPAARARRRARMAELLAPEPQRGLQGAA